MLFISRMLTSIAFVFSAFVVPHNAFAVQREPSTETNTQVPQAALPSHLQLLHDAEKIVAQRAAIEKQAKTHAEAIDKTRARIMNLPRELREKTLEAYATRLSEILTQLEQTAQTNGVPYREMSPEERAAAYQEAISIAEIIPSSKAITKDVVKVSAHTLVTAILCSVALWGSVQPKWENNGPAMLASFVGGLAALVSSITNGLHFDKFINSDLNAHRLKDWMPFWDKLSLTQNLPKKANLRNNWLMGRIHSAYEPKLRVEIRKTVARIAAQVECTNTLTERNYQDAIGLQEAADAELAEITKHTSQ